MRSKRWILLAIVMALMATILGCALLEQIQKAVGTAQETVSEVATVSEKEAPPTEEKEVAPPEEEEEKVEEEVVEETPSEIEEETEEEEGEVQTFGTLDSYRQKISMEVTTGDKVESLTVTAEVVREPLKQHVIFEGTDEEGEYSSWEMIQIEDTLYMREEEGEWTAMMSTEGEPPEQIEAFALEDVDRYLSSNHCRKVGSEDVEGHPAVRYDCSKEVLSEEDLMPYGETVLTADQLSDGGLQLWISKEYDAPVRITMWFEGKDDEGVYHKWYAETLLSSINEPIRIEPPEGVEMPGLPEDVPLMGEARLTSAMSGMVGFEVEMEMEKVLEFFKGQMPENGWTLESEYEGMLGYTKGDRRATIMLSEEEGKVSGVIIIVSEE